MLRIGAFEKVSREQFAEGARKCCGELAEEQIDSMYEGIVLPERATAGSAGYDLHLTAPLVLRPKETKLVATGIRARMQDGWALFVFPRSGLGFKYRLQLNNTIGVIDSDYYGSDNEGHIFVRLTNDSNEGKILELSAGDAFAQAIFLPFGITEDDDAKGVRNGGFGSTSAQKD